MTGKTVSVPLQGICTHPQTTYMLGNTYCAVCKDWLHAGFHKPASEPISVPTESHHCGICGNKTPPLYQNSLGGICCDGCRAANSWPKEELKIVATESRLNEAPTDNLRVNPYDLEPE